MSDCNAKYPSVINSAQCQADWYLGAIDCRPFYHARTQISNYFSLVCLSACVQIGSMLFSQKIYSRALRALEQI